ncbi:tRNA (adenosine(37)-N6)-dimethylallyltransferase MiaA [Singulisphaera acidiphila]|uniref:tRNA dimethylallyltransferase n=1 Tax=Singulisphaera acidiphila (strain ATCC BAA-1392 / DSM 18658 / VKM B-2454 / MOB10) TaxID=886293 RepID=L0DK24_SINAD|nr:tRNA (adenosine(37)-N6)-dimethylallyltransferase MiaA [Singulisphaera acidiphila]AGA29195.1 tRNA isopentenyltransferase MiaA [Singulisphaera acidiphila DSM 18658]
MPITTDSSSLAPLHRACYLTGPTASGKTGVGVALAQRLNAEVIAMDSMTLYRGMDIGTAKPTHEEQEGVTHHLIDVLDPWQAASVADFRGWALKAVADVESRGKRALFVGGTALYLKALLRGLFEAAETNRELRESLEDEYRRLGGAVLHARLESIDPVTARRLHPNDRLRIVRALEVNTTMGRPLSSLQTEHEHPAPATVPVFAIERPRPEIHARINLRVDLMIQDGLVDEVRTLQSGSQPLGPVPAQGVGYREVIEYLEGRTAFGRAVEQIKARTRQFAKRQSTWFRGLVEVRSWPVPEGEPAEMTADRLAHVIGVGN